MRRAYAITILAALALVLAAGAPAYADPGGNGNGQGNPPGHAGNGNNGNGGGSDGSPNGANGTVKIHDWPEHKNSSEMANDPKVCQFEIHGFNFDSGQADDWWIQEHKWGNGDKSKSVLGGSYTASSSGDWTSGPHSLPDGHYKLFVEMSHQAGNSGNTVVTHKHKVFKVDCPPVTGGAEGGQQQGGQQQGGQQQQNNAVAGVQQPPMTGGVSPAVGGAAQPGAQAGAQVAGQQAAPVTSLPSTSTAPTAPLMTPLLLGIGMWLMRRRSGGR